MLLNDDAFYYDDNREEMISILNSQNWLEKRKILSTRADVYSTKVARPHFYLTNTRETLKTYLNYNPQS